MKNYNPVSWFELPVGDLDRAKKFYEDVVDTEIELHEMGPLKMGWFPMAEGKGSSGALVENENYVPSYEGALVYFTCPDIEKALELVKENGGKVINGKSSIGEFGFVAHFEDCEGNRVALHSSK